MFTPIHKMTIFLLPLLLFCGSLQAKIVDEEQAALVARELLSVSDKGLTRAHLARAAKPDLVEQPYYIFTGTDGKGFVIVSADDVARPILGYSLDAEILPDGELPLSMEQWLSSVSNQILLARQKGVVQTAEIARQWNNIKKGATKVQLQTAKWGQSAPYYDQCPLDNDTRSLAGCVPVAYAILMKYYGYPTAGTGTTPAYYSKKNDIFVPERDLNHEYDWDNMLMEYEDGHYTSEQGNSVAALMADIGAALQVDYSQNATSGTMGLSAVFRYFDFFPGKPKRIDYYTSEEWFQMLCDELDKNRPVLYSASDADNVGHAFLLDGYTDDGYVSVNWGWYGHYNGFYTIDALQPGDLFYATQHVAWLDCVPMPLLGYGDAAQIGDRIYPSLAVAVGDVPQGVATTINVLADEELDRLLIDQDRDVTIVLNGHSLDLLLGIFNHGRLTLIGSDQSEITCGNNCELLCNYGVLDIKGGTYKHTLQNKPENDYRRCLWTADDSETRLSEATFEGTHQVMCTKGKLTIESGDYTCIDNGCIIANYCIKDSVKILGGNFANIEEQIDGTDYRRCIWTRDSTTTLISDGTFRCAAQVICTNGKLTIESGDFFCTGNNSVVSNYCTIDTVSILGGSYVNDSENSAGNDYRRCVWSKDGSYTRIGGGYFRCAGQVVCVNGKLTVESGDFVGTGNSAVVSNYCTRDTVEILGGSFMNVAEEVSASDYRRCLWSTNDSKMMIGEALFNNKYGTQTLCFNGQAVIDGAVIENENGKIGCLAGSTGSVVIESCRLSAEVILYANGNGGISCKGGLYSDIVKPQFLAEGCQCVENTQEETLYKYPYMVQNTLDNIHHPSQTDDMTDIYYNIQGIQLPGIQKGMNIIRKGNGKTMKVFSR